MEIFHKGIDFIVRCITPKKDVFLAFERFDAQLTARDNVRIEIAKRLAQSNELDEPEIINGKQWL